MLSLVYSLDHLVGDEYALAKLLSTVYHTMTHRTYFLVVLDKGILRVYQGIEDQLYQPPFV